MSTICWEYFTKTPYISNSICQVLKLFTEGKPILKRLGSTYCQYTCATSLLILKSQKLLMIFNKPLGPKFNKPKKKQKKIKIHQFFKNVTQKSTNLTYKTSRGTG